MPLSGLHATQMSLDDALVTCKSFLISDGPITGKTFPKEGRQNKNIYNYWMTPQGKFGECVDGWMGVKPGFRDSCVQCVIHFCIFESSLINPV